jgi:hypothetical protein
MRSHDYSLIAGAGLPCLGMGAAAELPANPWALLPAPPTSCYRRKRQLGLQGADATEYRSTAAVKAAIDYGERLQRIFAERLEEPIDMEARYIGKVGATVIGLRQL